MTSIIVVDAADRQVIQDIHNLTVLLDTEGMTSMASALSKVTNTQGSPTGAFCCCCKAYDHGASDGYQGTSAAIPSRSLYCFPEAM